MTAAAVIGAHAVLAFALLASSPTLRRTITVAPLQVLLLAAPAADAPSHGSPPHPRPPAPAAAAPRLSSAPPPIVIAEPVVPAPPSPPLPPASPSPTSPPSPLASPVAEPLSAPVPLANPTAVAAAPAPTPPRRQLAATQVRYAVPPAAEVPRLARRARESGVVWLRVVVDTQGRPAQMRIERSSGFARLDEQALAAMRQARFVPHTEDGQAVEVEVVAPIEYVLE